MANICTACRHSFTGHVACPACGNYRYVSSERHAGMVARGPAAYQRREELKAAGFRWDADRKEWYVPEGVSADQADAIDVILDDRRGLQCGFWLRD